MASQTELNDFALGNELLIFCNSVLNRVEAVFEADFDVTSIEALIVVVDRTISLIRSIINSEAVLIDDNDKENLEMLSEAFVDVLYSMQHCISLNSLNPTTVAQDFMLTTQNELTPGRPPYEIPAEVLEDLLGLNFSWAKVAAMLGVSRWTIWRRVREYGLQDMTGFIPISDDELDSILQQYIANHGTTTGQVFISGYLKSQGLLVQRRRIRESMARVDPRNTVLRWGITVSRRIYRVPWPNSLWHLDGHHSLIRWKLVVHGCIDGFSRRILYLSCSSNNLAETGLELFLDAILKDGERWPSRIRVDRGVENVLVCDAMVQARGEGRGSFIAGPSTHNQRIERLWRDVYRCVCHLFYYVFYGMELSGILNTEDPLHILTLHLIYIPRINMALSELMAAFNHHGVRTEANWTPYQMWVNGMDENPDDIEFYGPDGPSTQEESSNHVVVEPVVIDADRNRVETFVLERVDPLKNSSEFGIDIYKEALELVMFKVNELMS